MNSDCIKNTWSAHSKSFYSGAVDETVKFGGGNIMILGYTPLFGVSYMQWIVRRMNKVHHLNITDYLVPTLDRVAVQSGFTIRSNINF